MPRTAGAKVGQEAARSLIARDLEPCKCAWHKMAMKHGSGSGSCSILATSPRHEPCEVTIHEQYMMHVHDKLSPMSNAAAQQQSSMLKYAV